MRVRTRGFLIALTIIALLLLAACGGKGKSANAESDAGAAPAAVSDASAAPVAVSEAQGDPAKGQQAFQSACVACHGPDAKGVTGLGKSLHPSDSEFVRSHSDAELVEFIKVGRQPDDPLNTTGVAMPPKGGNPAISDDDLYNIVAWIRTLD